MPKSRVLLCWTQAAVLTSELSATRTWTRTGTWTGTWTGTRTRTWTRSYGPAARAINNEVTIFSRHDLRGMGREDGIIALHQSAMICAGHVNLEAHCRERPYLHETERDQRYISTPWSRRCYSALGFDFGEDLRRSLASRASSQRRIFIHEDRTWYII